MAKARNLQDTYHNYAFTATFNTNDGQAILVGFSKISGLTRSIEEITYRTGDQPLFPSKQPGQLMFDDITAERGMTDDSRFLQRILNVADGRAEFGSLHGAGSAPSYKAIKDTFAINVLDRTGREQRGFTLQGAWIKSWALGDLDASGNEVLIETLTIAFDYFTDEFFNVAEAVRSL
jgi:phage tail-like protein